MRTPRGDTRMLTARIARPLWRAARLAALKGGEQFQTWVADALAAHLARCRRHEHAPRSRGNGPRPGAEGPP
jgi:hypothetical protein